jgi:hypothetical protein
MYVLLDLNYTLVSNSIELRGKGTFHRYSNERYRVWLLDILRALKPQGIFLVTVRPDTEREMTLSRIAAMCDGWQPDDVFFSTMNVAPPVWKRHACLNLIFPKYGDDRSQYLAVESNLDTQKMYATLSIRGLKVFPANEGEPEETGSGAGTGMLF